MVSTVTVGDVSSVVRIVEFRERHITPRYLSWLSDAEIVKYSEQRHHAHTFESCQHFFLSNLHAGNKFFAVEILRNDEWLHVGNTLGVVDSQNEICDMSILIGERTFQGRGIGTAAWLLSAARMFRESRIRKITAGTMRVNQPMLDIFSRTGMEIVAEIPGKFLLEGMEVDLLVAQGFPKGFEGAAKRLLTEAAWE